MSDGEERIQHNTVMSSLLVSGRDILLKEVIFMNRVALIGIMVENNEAFARINEIIHDYSKYVVGRMGLPNVRDNLNIISIVFDAPNDIINTAAGKLGRIEGVTSKTIYSKLDGE